MSILIENKKTMRIRQEENLSRKYFLENHADCTQRRHSCGEPSKCSGPRTSVVQQFQMFLNICSSFNENLDRDTQNELFVQIVLRRRAKIPQLFGGLLVVLPPAFPMKTLVRASTNPRILARDVEFRRFFDAVGKKNRHTNFISAKKRCGCLACLLNRTRNIQPKCGQKSCRWTPRLGIRLCPPSLRKYYANRACA